MKKILLSLGVVAIAFILSGCGKTNRNPAEENPNQNTADIKSNVANKIVDSAEAVKNALLGGQALECTYKIKNGSNMGEIKGYMDGKKYKSSFEANGEKYVSLMNGETIYSWSEKTKQGTKMSLQCMQDLKKSLPQDTSQNNYKSPEEMADDMMDINCQPISSAIDFSVPTDITFSDTCEQMKKTMEQLENIKGLPTGKTLP